MPTNPRSMFRTPHILIDANLLTLFLVGLFDKRLIETFKRTRAYTVADYNRLVAMVGEYHTIVLTPSVLGEVSNLCGHLDGKRRRAFFQWLATILPVFLPEPRRATHPVFLERTVALSQVMRSSAFVPFGFADATIEQLSADGLPVLTDDARLYMHLSEKDRDVVNFTHGRDLA
jgi:hypothetical protein